jgi:ribosomal protein S18 acetylase RimI-like enzyme
MLIDGHVIDVCEGNVQERETVIRILNSIPRENIPPYKAVPLSVILRTENGEIVGGLLGNTNMEWFHIEILAVSQSLRGLGFGSKLLQAGEAAAKEKGCRFAFLNTFSYQAPEFYKKYGYTVFGTLDHFPAGHQRIFMQKILV